MHAYISVLIPYPLCSSRFGSSCPELNYQPIAYFEPRAPSEMTAKALIVVAMCAFLSLSLHGCGGCDSEKMTTCMKDAGLNALKCDIYSACVKDNGCCDADMTDEKGASMKGSAASKTICEMTKSKDDKCL